MLSSQPRTVLTDSKLELRGSETFGERRDRNRFLVTLNRRNQKVMNGAMGRSSAAI
jgi:hypothetical protein